MDEEWVEGWGELGSDPTKEDIIQLPEGLTIEVKFTIVKDHSEDED